MRKTILKKTAILTLLLFASCKKTDAVSNRSEYEAYISLTDANLTTISPAQNQQREKWLSELKQNPVYAALVDSAVVSTEYLSTLNAVSDAIKNTYLENGKPVFGISDNIASEVSESELGNDKMNFVIPVAAMAIGTNGGIPEKIVAVFERYKKRFQYYGSAGDIVIFPSGKQEKLKQDYNLSYVLALLDPTDKKH